MAHQRKRYLFQKYSELIKFSPLLGILGHRQVGKTTFLEAHAKRYFTFDDEDTLIEATQSPKRFIQSLSMPMTAIDESQFVPGIFPALKERVRVNKTPGQIILSGSVRFTSKAAIRESLTGRIQYLEMIPMTIGEIEGEPFSHKLRKILSTQHLPSLIEQLSSSISTIKFYEKRIETYRQNGGLPGLCFIRKATTLHDKILDQLKTILDRDLRQIYSSQLTFDVIHEFLAEIAMNEGRLFHYQDYRKKTGLSPITQKKLLYAFEAIFLIRRIPVEGGKRGFTLLLEDQAESNFLSGSKKSTSIELMGLLYRNLRAECFYQTDKPIQVFQFTTRTGKTVPLGFRNDQFSVGFVLTESDQISREQRGVASSFLKHYANSKIIFVSQGRKLAQIDERSMLCPLSCLL